MTGDGVGYGRPPKHSQFKPGTSGNASGRPKGRISFARLLEKQLDARMTATIGGRTKTITRREALIYGFVGDALKDKDRVRKHMIDLLLILEAQSQPATADAGSDVRDDAIIKNLLQRYGVDPASKPALTPKSAKIIKIKKPKEKSK